MRALEGQEEERCDLLHEIAPPFERKAEAHPAPLLELAHLEEAEGAARRPRATPPPAPPPPRPDVAAAAARRATPRPRLVRPTARPVPPTSSASRPRSRRASTIDTRFFMCTPEHCTSARTSAIMAAP